MLLAWVAFLAVQSVGLAESPEERAERPSQGGRRGVDKATGEYFREPTARDDLHQRLPVEYMPPAAIPVERRTGAAEGEDDVRVLFDNGSLLDCSHCGAGGAGESQLGDLTSDRLTLGFGHQAAAGGRIADDFVVDDPDGWTVHDVFFFAYQTGSATRSTMTSADIRIWSGPPGIRGSSVVWDGGEANRLTDSSWSGLYRLSESSLGATNRPVMVNTLAVNTTLAPGTYWLDWQMDGRLASGPWAPSLAREGNARQSVDGGASWEPAADAGSGGAVDFPFVITGDSGMEGTGPKLVMHKTVALLGACPGWDPMTVSFLTEVSYCYGVENVGDTTFVSQSLVDDHLGTLFLNEEVFFPPGSTSAGVRSEITINSSIVANAVFTMTTANGQEVSAEDSSTVFVSPDRPLRCNDLPVGFESGIPSDWLAVNRIIGSPVIWTSVAGCGEADNYVGGFGSAACASSDLQGGGAGFFDTDLISSPFSLTGVETAALEFRVNYQNFLAQDRFDVDVSIDNGLTWSNLAAWTDDLGMFRSGSGVKVTLDLTPYVGEPHLRLRWRYYDQDASVAQDDWYVQINDVGLDCTLPVGGFRACRQPGLAIPDFDPGGVTDQMLLDESLGEIQDLDVALRVSHFRVGELTATLTHEGLGTTEPLFHLPGIPASPFGCDGEDIYAVIDDEGADGAVETTCQAFSPAISGTLVPGDPGGSSSLSVFDDAPAGASWTLFLSDLSTSVGGTLEEWCLIGTTCSGSLTNRVLNSDATIEDCGTLRVGPGVVVDTGFFELVNLRAATGVTFFDGVSISGNLQVEIDPSLAPP